MKCIYVCFLGADTKETAVRKYAQLTINWCVRSAGLPLAVLPPACGCCIYFFPAPYSCSHPCQLSFFYISFIFLPMMEVPSMRFVFILFVRLSWLFFVSLIIYHLSAIVFISIFFPRELGLKFYALMIFSLIYCFDSVAFHDCPEL